MIDLSLIIPVYNEEGCLAKNAATIKVFLDTLNKDYEIIFVNDGSTDRTPVIIEGLVENSPRCRSVGSARNRGKGNAVRRGVLTAEGQYVVFTDADLSVPIRFVETCLRKLQSGSPIVIGSRHLPSSSFKVREGPLRQAFGEVFRRLAQVGLGLRVSDVTCGMKGLERNTARALFSRSKIDRWGYDAELIFLAQKLHYVIDEIPVDWYHSFDSKVCVAIDAFRTFTEICRVHYYYMTKQYKI